MTKIIYNSEPLKCECGVTVRTDSMFRHQNSKKHDNNLKNKVKVTSKKGKVYYYDKDNQNTFTKRCKDEAYRKKHMDYCKQKIECEKCGAKVMRTGIYRHRESVKCLLFE